MIFQRSPKGVRGSLHLEGCWNSKGVPGDCCLIKKGLVYAWELIRGRRTWSGLRWCRSEDSETVPNGVNSENELFPFLRSISRLNRTMQATALHQRRDRHSSAANNSVLGVYMSHAALGILRAKRACSRSGVKASVAERPQCHPGLAYSRHFLAKETYISRVSVLCSDFLT